MNSTVERWRARAITFGEYDCFQLLGEHIFLLTGIDYRPRFPQYTSRDEALAILAEYGGAVGLLTSVLGDPKPVAHAGRGDALVRDFGDGLAAAICLGVNCCAPGPHGLRFDTTAAAVAAWTV